jgi:16S rRNA (adenine1518-N6/adenine1519-N6)-dimethyltransferase
MYKKYLSKVSIKKEYSQNFIRSKVLISKEVKYLKIKPHETILEVGAGLGDLTQEIVKYTDNIICIEKDKQFKKVLLNNPIFGKVKFVWGDATKKDIFKNISFDKAISNLPYRTSLPIILNILENTYFKQGVFILQNELAKKLSAKPNQTSYSRISVYSQSLSNIKYLQKINKGAFYPEPGVESALIRVIYDDSDDANFIRINHEDYRKFLESIFLKSDKQIYNIESLKKLDLGDRVLKLYPRQLSFKDFITLFKMIHGK